MPPHTLVFGGAHSLLHNASALRAAGIIQDKRVFSLIILTRHFVVVFLNDLMLAGKS